MATLEQPSRAEPIEYNVFLMDSVQPTPREWRFAGIGSVLVHLVALIVILSIPASVPDQTPEKEMPHRVTPLVDPPLPKLTQKAPNKAPISEEISAESLSPAPRVAKAQTVKRFAPPPAQVAQKNPAPAVPQEPPKLNPVAQAPQIVLPAVKPPPPSTEPPKLAFESVPPAPTGGGHGTGRLKIPGGGVDEVIRDMARNGGGGSLSLGDDTESTPPETSRFNPTPSPTRPKSSIELVSDPKGVDFKPYLLQVLQSVRRNWFAQMPESARLGIRGRVVVEFYVAKDGTITKAVYITRSGSEALDRATIAALSMSNRLPQLPAEFTGDKLGLRFTFMYNAPR